MRVPDRIDARHYNNRVISAKPSDREWACDFSNATEAQYLLSSPARELADEMVNVLKMISGFETLFEGGSAIASPEASLAKKVLAKLEESK